MKDLPTVELVPIASIHKNPKNPRIIKDDKFKKLVKSVKGFSQMLFIRPVVIDSERMILGGNMRYEAAIEAGRKDIPIILADNLTDDQKKEFIIKDNVSGGEWDWSELANEWDIDSLCEWGLDLPNVDIDIEDEEDNIDVKSMFKVEIECGSESVQEKMYNELLSRGFECKLLTL